MNTATEVETACNAFLRCLVVILRRDVAADVLRALADHLRAGEAVKRPGAVPPERFKRR